MNDIRYKWILNIIVFVILCTIAIQGYWNYRNYKASKQQLINEVQISLDNAVESYYTRMAHHKTMAFAFSLDDEQDIKLKKDRLDSIIENLGEVAYEIESNDSLRIEIIENISLLNNEDSLNSRITKNWKPKQVNIEATHKSLDSITEDSFKLLTSKVIYSISNDTLDLNKIDSLVGVEFNRKKLDLYYTIFLNTGKDSIQSSSQKWSENSYLKTTSKSSLLPPNSELSIHFYNSSNLILKRIIIGGLVSLLLILLVISCLFYLFKIIKQQKQLAEVKNDLISNITHEFKTPIATISVALESISNFDTLKDFEKTKNYLNMSTNQLGKLNTMVEKLLETATLDSESLELNKERYDITQLVENVVTKFKIQAPNKEIVYKKPENNIFAHLDVFHFENALSNVIDNAVKYGGDFIEITLTQTVVCFTITVTDNGNSLDKNAAEHIFEKFYRVPKGNTHNVKGFGIGLYYTKHIIEKHGGVITLNLEPKTTFKMSLPNV